MTFKQTIKKLFGKKATGLETLATEVSEQMQTIETKTETETETLEEKTKNKKEVKIPKSQRVYTPEEFVTRFNAFAEKYKTKQFTASIESNDGIVKKDPRNCYEFKIQIQGIMNHNEQYKLTINRDFSSTWGHHKHYIFEFVNEKGSNIKFESYHNYELKKKIHVNNMLFSTEKNSTKEARQVRKHTRKIYDSMNKTINKEAPGFFNFVRYSNIGPRKQVVDELI